MLSPPVFLGSNLVSIPKAPRLWSLVWLSAKRNQGSLESSWVYYSMFGAEKAEVGEKILLFWKSTNACKDLRDSHRSDCDNLNIEKEKQNSVQNMSM